MRNKVALIVFLFIGIFLMNCTAKDVEGNPILEKDITLIIEPHKSTCSGAFGEQPCLVLNGSTEPNGVSDFKFEEGVWKKILVDKFQRPENIQDVGSWGYRFKTLLDEIKEADNPTPQRLCDFYEGQWTENEEGNCTIGNGKLQKKYCEHVPDDC